MNVVEISSSEMLVSYHIITRCHKPEDCNFSHYFQWFLCSHGYFRLFRWIFCHTNRLLFWTYASLRYHKFYPPQEGKQVLLCISVNFTFSERSPSTHWLENWKNDSHSDYIGEEKISTCPARRRTPVIQHVKVTWPSSYSDLIVPKNSL